MQKISLNNNFVKNVVKLALNEDLYPLGDITSELIKNVTVEMDNLMGALLAISNISSLLSSKCFMVADIIAVLNLELVIVLCSKYILT